MIRSLPVLPAGYRLVFHESIGSTNDDAKRLARDGAAEGTLVWALEQTAGRGRRGRAWVSPRGNLYASVVMRPNCPANRAAQLGFVAALAIGGGLASLFPRLDNLSYKWPNDVLVSGRKIAGILLESETSALEEVEFVVVGVGINLVTSPRNIEFPATSIMEEDLGEVAPAVMLEAFTRHLQFWVEHWRECGFGPVRTAWRAATAPCGEPIRVRLGVTSLHGRFLGIDEEGALILEAEGGRRHIAAGEVFPATR
jgi:BirA family biotin operon repressor/biotin-[acetyl-CoA-carboxylase] ligase